jgi:ribosomal-protein-alanine N-acetyltransferase
VKTPQPVVLEDEETGIRLVPLTPDDAAGMKALSDEPGVEDYTFVASVRDENYGHTWVARYVEGWKDGSRAGFAIRDTATDAFLGFIGLVRIERDEDEAEAGYALNSSTRGRGAATAGLRLLSDWALRDLGVARLELHIDPENRSSVAVADRCGYIKEGVLRSVYFKEGRRGNFAVYSLLPGDLPH